MRVYLDLCCLKERFKNNLRKLINGIPPFFQSSTKQPPAKAGGFMLRTESPDTRRLNDAS